MSQIHAMKDMQREKRWYVTSSCNGIDLMVPHGAKTFTFLLMNKFVVKSVSAIMSVLSS